MFYIYFKQISVKSTTIVFFIRTKYRHNLGALSMLGVQFIRGVIYHHTDKNIYLLKALKPVTSLNDQKIYSNMKSEITNCDRIPRAQISTCAHCNFSSHVGIPCAFVGYCVESSMDLHNTSRLASYRLAHRKEGPNITPLGISYSWKWHECELWNKPSIKNNFLMPGSSVVICHDTNVSTNETSVGMYLNT